MTSASAFLHGDATKVCHFNGAGVIGGPKEGALMAAMNDLKCGEILRLFIDQNPIVTIRKLVIRFGSKLTFQYLQNRDGAVIIDFKKIHD